MIYDGGLLIYEACLINLTTRLKIVLWQSDSSLTLDYSIWLLDDDWNLLKDWSQVVCPLCSLLYLTPRSSTGRSVSFCGWCPHPLVLRNCDQTQVLNHVSPTAISIMENPVINIVQLIQRAKDERKSWFTHHPPTHHHKLLSHFQKA